MNRPHPLRRAAFARFRYGASSGVRRPPDGSGWVTYEDDEGNTGYVVDEDGARIIYSDDAQGEVV
jgi:hypothetical protein